MRKSSYPSKYLLSLLLNLSSVDRMSTEARNEDICNFIKNMCKVTLYTCECRSADVCEAVIDFGNLEKNFVECYKALSNAEIAMISQPHPLGAKIYMQKLKHKRPHFHKMLSLLLFIVTLASVFWTGTLIAQGNFELLKEIGLETKLPSTYSWAATYALSIMGILGLHELGHIIASARCIGSWSPPLFIPAPGFGLGTFGAIVTSRFRPSTPTCLALLGISGPALGFTISLLVLMVGALTSIYVSPELLPPAETLHSIPLISLLAWLVVPGAEGKAMIPNAAAFAGVIMIYIHFLNLLPIGQLDGGHVVASIIGPNTSRFISLITLILILVYALLYPTDLILIAAIFAVLAFFLTGLRRHPGAACNLYESRIKRAIIATFYVLMLGLSVPVPIS